jgi:hypothetical protein
VAACQQFGLNQTDVFAIDKNGTLRVAWVVGAGNWNGPSPIGAAAIFLPGAGVAAGQQFGLTQTDVFAVDKNGTLNVAWVVEAGNWNGPAPIGPAGMMLPGATPSTCQQAGLTQTDVFVVDKNGDVNVFWVVGGGNWNGPTHP